VLKNELKATFFLLESTKSDYFKLKNQLKKVDYFGQNNKLKRPALQSTFLSIITTINQIVLFQTSTIMTTLEKL
jgi:vacuolar-type H+-ATPase subunit D/Vma8